MRLHGLSGATPHVIIAICALQQVISEFFISISVLCMHLPSNTEENYILPLREPQYFAVHTIVESKALIDSWCEGG